MCELKDQDPVITLCAELEENYPGFGFERAAIQILAERQTQPYIDGNVIAGGAKKHP